MLRQKFSGNSGRPMCEDSNGGLKRVEACERRASNQPRAPFDLSFLKTAADNECFTGSVL